jgi:hypothetical protein
MGLDRSRLPQLRAKPKELCGPNRAASIGRAGAQRVFWGCNAARGWLNRKAQPALILMGDWCATAQPQLENQGIVSKLLLQVMFDPIP